jgi:hypothetical protein
LDLASASWDQVVRRASLVGVVSLPYQSSVYRPFETPFENHEYKKLHYFCKDSLKLLVEDEFQVTSFINVLFTLTKKKEEETLLWRGSGGTFFLVHYVFEHHE